MRAGKRGGHKAFTHNKLAKIGSGSFNCGRGKNPEIKPVYVVKIIKVLKECSEDLNAFLKRESHDD